MFFNVVGSRRIWNCSNVCFGVLLLGCATLLTAAELRTWTDSTGKVKIKAKFVSIEDGKVTLEREDGNEVEIDLKKLSAADQKVVADLQKEEDPFKPKADDPFKKKPATGGTGNSGKTMPAKPTEVRVIVPDYSDAKTVTVSPPDEPWKFEVPERPATAPAPGAKVKPKTIATPRKSGFFEGVKGFVACPSGKFAAVGYSMQNPGPNQPATTRVIVCDLDKAKVIGEGSLPGKFIPLALHNDGKQVLMKKDEFGFGNSERLELWNIAAKSASKGTQWIPYEDANGGDRDVAWGAFIGDNRMASVSNAGKLVIWNAEEIKPELTMQIQGGCKPAVSPDQKWLAFATGKEVAVLDINAGEIVAMQTTPQVQWPVLSFSPGQKRLCMAAFDRLFVWDFSNGELYREIPYNGLHVMGNITCPSDDHVLLGNHYLIDLENQVKLWDYQGGDGFAQQIAGMTWFVVSEGDKKPGAVVGLQIPSPMVKDALARALSAPDFFVLKPGTVVKIDVSGVDAAGKDYVTKALAARLKEAGYDSGPNGTIDLVAQTQVGTDRQVSYHTFGRPGSQTYTVRDFICRIKFSYKGQDVWQTQIGSVPGFIHLGQNETLDQYLKKSEKFNFDWFGKVDLPKLLQKPAQVPAQVAGAPAVQVQTVGVSKLSTAGAQ